MRCLTETERAYLLGVDRRWFLYAARSYQRRSGRFGTDFEDAIRDAWGEVLLWLACRLIKGNWSVEMPEALLRMRLKHRLRLVMWNDGYEPVRHPVRMKRFSEIEVKGESGDSEAFEETVAWDASVAAGIRTAAMVLTLRGVVERCGPSIRVTVGAVERVVEEWDCDFEGKAAQGSGFIDFVDRALRELGETPRSRKSVIARLDRCRNKIWSGLVEAGVVSGARPDLRGKR